MILKHRMAVCIRSFTAPGLVLLTAQFSLAASGPDVVHTSIHNTSAYGPVGGVRAYSLGSNTCNIGDTSLIWADDGTPGLAMNMYRLYDGRLEQIGMSWLKTACCAFEQNGCGLGCTSTPGSNLLGAGCLDIYDASWNASQSRMMRRSNVNGFTGAFTGSVAGGSGGTIATRLQVAQSDLTAANFPGALYFAEGHYVGTDDAASGNAMNNASYNRVTVNGTTFALTLTGGTQTSIPAIYAWQDHGLGVNTPDHDVEIVEVDVPSEGRFIVGAKSEDIGGGLHRYTYAVSNFNSDRSGGSFSVPLPSGALVSEIGFHDVDYHSGDPYSNTDWNSVVSADSIAWSSPQTFAQNPNSNALRYATMYTFWFTANVPPTTGDVTIGLFKPGATSSITASVSIPADLGCGVDLGDVNGDLLKNGTDISSFTDCILTGSTSNGNCNCADMDLANGVDMGDVGIFVTAILAG